MERDIAEQLLESRIHHNRCLPDGWLATVEYCLELAKARYNDGKDTVYIDVAHSHVRLTLQEHNILVKDRAATLARAR